MSDSMWYVAVDGQTVGPMSEAELVDALVRDTRRLLPVSLFLDGEYEIENVAMSIPAVVGSDGVQKVHLPRLEKDELESLRISAAKMKDFLERRRP